MMMVRRETGGVTYGGVGGGAVGPRGWPVVLCRWLDTHGGKAALNRIEGWGRRVGGAGRARRNDWTRWLYGTLPRSRASK